VTTLGELFAYLKPRGVLSDDEREMRVAQVRSALCALLEDARPTLSSDDREQFVEDELKDLVAGLLQRHGGAGNEPARKPRTHTSERV